VTKTYGSRNSFAGDTAQARPTAFHPDDNAFDFSVPFTSGQTLSWTLVPPGGPSTVVQANAGSPICDPSDQTFICAKACDAQQAAECADPGVTRSRCIGNCLSDTVFYAEYFPCGVEWNGYQGCIASVPPPAQNWDCSFPGFPAVPVSPNCDAEVGALLTCLGY
jgi:hypothetical protein